MKLETTIIYLFVMLATTSSCHMEDNRSHSQIAYQTKEMIRHYKEGNLVHLPGYFLDSAYLSGPGGYRVRGKEVLGDFWLRHFLPLDWKSESQRYYRTLDEIKSQLPPNMNLPWPSPGTSKQDDLSTKRMYELATWTWTFQREEGIIQKEVNQVIVCWIQTGNGAWKIAELFMY